MIAAGKSTTMGDGSVGSDLNCLSIDASGEPNCPGTGRKDRSHSTLTAHSLIDLFAI